jgi:hypothetical protein
MELLASKGNEDCLLELLDDVGGGRVDSSGTSEV